MMRAPAGAAASPPPSRRGMLAGAQGVLHVYIRRERVRGSTVYRAPDPKIKLPNLDIAHRALHEFDVLLQAL